jgi:hypothetical protein
MVACGVKRAGTGEAGPDGPKSGENFDMGIFHKFFWTTQGF